VVRRYSASRIRSQLRQAQQKQKQAIDAYNREVRRYNQKVKTAVDQYNREVRAHNSRVRANRQRLKSEVARLNRQQPTTTTRFVTYRTSVQTLHESYTRLETRAEAGALDPAYNRVLDLSEREVANSFAVANQLLDPAAADEECSDLLEDAELLDRLQRVSPDLDARWRGAVYALNPQNPDAARHFCTSAREIFTQVLEIKAPDDVVFQAIPECPTTDEGRPTRRSKIRYMLQASGMTESALEEFAEDDMENIIQLFRTFNDGTHGTAGAFTGRQLLAIRKRVEDGIVFLTEIALDA